MVLADYLSVYRSAAAVAMGWQSRRAAFLFGFGI